MTEPEYKTKKDVVVERIREAILAAEYKPGDRLLQDEIDKRLNVSPTPVREALRQLEAEGVLDHSPHRGEQIVAKTIQQGGMSVSSAVRTYNIPAPPTESAVDDVVAAFGGVLEELGL